MRDRNTQNRRRNPGNPRWRGKVRWRGVLLFVALAYVGAWAATLPLLLSGYHRADASPVTGLFVKGTIALMMLTPAIAALVTLKFIHRPASIRRAIGLVRPQSWRRFVTDSLLAMAVPVLLQLGALVVATAAGTYHPDLVNFSGFREVFAPATLGETGPPVAALAMWLGTGLLTMLIWLPMFFGEELGWQGYLLPRLAPLGTAPALIGTALVFALWHLPALLMGGQYPGHSWPVSIAVFVVSTTLLLPVFAWLRIRGDSVWPAVLAHSVVSGPAIGLIYVFSDADAELDLLSASMAGWPGWVVTGSLVIFLVVTGRLRVDSLPGVETAVTAERVRTEPGKTEDTAARG